MNLTLRTRTNATASTRARTCTTTITSISIHILVLLSLLTSPLQQVRVRVCVLAFQPTTTNIRNQITTTTPISIRTPTPTKTTAIQMGLFDFFKTRQDDFIKLNESQDTFGPGPLVLLYNIPHGIEDEEIDCMLQDGAPVAYASSRNGNGRGRGNSNGNEGGNEGGTGIAFQRIYPRDFIEDESNVNGVNGSDKTVQQVLEQALLSTTKKEGATTHANSNADENTDANTYIDTNTPILLFSGISNQEMMKCYNIIAKEIYEETQGMANAACAKVVKPALGKSFRELMEEISGDHADAMRVGIAEEMGDGDEGGGEE